MVSLILVTPTYKNPKRIFFISTCINMFKNVPDVTWVLCEDGDSIDEEVDALLSESKIPYKYLSFGPTNDKGNEQRNFCYEYIVSAGLKGIVYNADDDNEYDIRLFDEVKKTKNLSVFPVGNLGPNGIERPILKNGKILYWDAYWKCRRFPLDMAGFAFNSEYLYTKKQKNHKLWDHHGIGGETEFIGYITNSYDDLEFLCNGCTVCYVKHNELHKLC
jgi:galactosylgalactosylxylosylprotein 3-beta-glucuronosyltransferase 3